MVMGLCAGAMGLFAQNRRDGSRILSSAIAITFIGLIRSNTTWGQVVLVVGTGVSLWFWHCYRQLKH
jgi:hypothetical protein